MNSSRQFLIRNSSNLHRFMLINRFYCSTTIDGNEINKFSKLADEWWDENGPMKALHSMNRVRVPWISKVLSKKIDNSALPLRNIKIADIGCGAGILCEPLSRLGALVTGVDASDENIKIANLHMKNVSEILKSTNIDRKSTNIDYFATSVEEFASKNEYVEKFDAVIASEILEHVSDCELFIKNCVKLLKPEGIFFITTINRTILSKIFAIYVAEQILNLVPKGIHDWEKFVPPENVEFYLARENCSVKMISGLCYNPLTNRWRWIRDTNVNYGLHAVKNS